MCRNRARSGGLSASVRQRRAWPQPSTSAPSRWRRGTSRRDEASRDPSQRGKKGRIDFAAVNAAALRELPTLLARWLPDGRATGHEYEARNPRRADRHPGSFRVNLRTGRWSDFATGDRGGDPVSLAAYLHGLSQIEAARRLADTLGAR